MVHTVLGDIAPEELGVTLCHEHIFCGSGDMAKAFGSRFYDKERLISAAVRQIREAKEKFGLCTVLDGTPIDLGRDVEIMRRSAQESGVNIVASTGFYYDERSFLNGADFGRIMELFLRECREGMEDTWKTENPVLPGMLKCATGGAGVTDGNRMYLTVMGTVQKETGLPLFAHNEHRIHTAPEQLDVLERAGANPEKIICGHASDSDDIPYLENLLKRGVYLGFDRLWGEEKHADTVVKLLERGWGKKILLSRDGGAFVAFGKRTFEEEVCRRENTFTAVLDTFCSMLRVRGVSESEIGSMLVGNIQKLFA